MRKIICIANQKGGVGKTTTAINLAATLAAAEKRTLLIDCDSQGNASSGMGIDREAINKKNLYHSLIGKVPLKDVIVGTQLPYLDVAPANQDLIGRLSLAPPAFVVSAMFGAFTISAARTIGELMSTAARIALPTPPRSMVDGQLQRCSERFALCRVGCM